jgi:2-polyprenyl-6-methoxyphenol hydroxylase-like FAD-dependent oxidoreductase
VAKAERVLIVGGGIGGMSAALALAQRGLQPQIVEVQSAWKVYGVGIIQPSNALRALDRIGLAQACLDSGAGFGGWHICTSDGTRLASVANRNVARDGFPPINGISRPALHGILSDAIRAARVPVRLGLTIDRLQERGDRIHVRFSDESSGEYDLVIGADGAHSKLRTLLYEEALQPRLTGAAVWRYNLPRPPTLEWGALYYGRRSKAGLVPMSPTTLYMLLVTPEPVSERMPRTGLAARMRERLVEYTGIIGELRELIIDDDAVVYRPMESMLAPPPWRRGRICLIGDAAHCTTPHLAQGAALAIEDAVVLADLLAGGSSLDDVFDEFMRRRWSRAQKVVSASLQLGEWEMQQWAGAPNPNDRAAELLHEATEAMMDPL